MHHLRKITIAVAIPIAAIVGVALTAGAATSSPTAVPGVAATDENPGNGGGQTGGPQQNNPNIAPSGLQTFKTFKTLTKGPTGTKSPKTATPTPSKTSATPSPSKTSATPSPSRSSARPSGSAGVVPGVPGAPITNCAGKTVTAPVTVKVGTAGGKQALVDNDGCALYVNSQDTPQQSACTGSCIQQWPPLVGPGQAGDGVDQANLAVFSRDDGAQQVTYFGHQLYYFKGDTQPGDANGQGMQQAWFLIDASGNPITQ